MDGIYTIEEVAEKIGYTEKTLMHYIYTRHPIREYFKKMGRKWVITEDDFYRFVEDEPYVGEEREE